MLVIGLNGRKQSGKDTAFKFIVEAAQGLRVTRAAFADKMKLSGVRALGFTPDTVEEAVVIADEIKEYGAITVATRKLFKEMSGREYWQWYGTEAHRHVYDMEFHVNALLPQPSGHPNRENRECDNDDALKKTFPDTDILVVTDARFENEAARIRGLGGVVWYIDAEKRLGPLPPDSHPSEHPLPSHLIDTVVYNGGDRADFRDAVRATLAGEIRFKQLGIR